MTAIRSLSAGLCSSQYATSRATHGDAAASGNAAVKIEAEYTIPTQHHQPLEPHAIVAVWEADDKLTVYDKNQGVKSAQGQLAQAFKLPRENVQVIAKYIGGAFGSGSIFRRSRPTCISMLRPYSSSPCPAIA